MYMHAQIEKSMCIVVIDYFNKAVMEEKANGCWTRNWCFFELLGCDGPNELFELRTRFRIVID